MKEMRQDTRTPTLSVWCKKSENTVDRGTTKTSILLDRPLIFHSPPFLSEVMINSNDNFTEVVISCRNRDRRTKKPLRLYTL